MKRKVRKASRTKVILAINHPGPKPNYIERRLVHEGRKIDAIKNYRSRVLGAGLRHAKVAIETYAGSKRFRDREKRIQRARKLNIPKT